jgi:hypothetical protein
MPAPPLPMSARVSDLLWELAPPPLVLCEATVRALRPALEELIEYREANCAQSKK